MEHYTDIEMKNCRYHGVGEFVMCKIESVQIENNGELMLSEKSVVETSIQKSILHFGCQIVKQTDLVFSEKFSTWGHFRNNICRDIV